MTYFVTSDHHFDHENIIEYCNRPFDSLDEMNEYMKSAWNSVVSEEDVVIHIGDVMFSNNTKKCEELLSELNGNILIIEGNHDNYINTQEFRHPLLENCVYTHKGFRFYCTHRRESVPDSWTEWVLCGHTHNDDPFINTDLNTINVSVDVTEFYPLPIDSIVKAVKEMNSGPTARTISDSPLRHHQWYINNIS